MPSIGNNTYYEINQNINIKTYSVKFQTIIKEIILKEKILNLWIFEKYFKKKLVIWKKKYTNLGNSDFYKTTLAIMLYVEKLNIYIDKNKEEVKAPSIIVRDLIEYYKTKLTNQNKIEINNIIKVIEFLLLCIKCCEQLLHKITISNLPFKDNIKVLKLYSDNDFVNMIDSISIFIQPQKLDELYKNKVNKLSTEYIKDE